MLAMCRSPQRLKSQLTLVKNKTKQKKRLAFYIKDISLLTLNSNLKQNEPFIISPNATENTINKTDDLTCLKTTVGRSSLKPQHDLSIENKKYFPLTFLFPKHLSSTN